MVTTPGVETIVELAREEMGTGARPHLLITGGVHGDEFEPMAALRELIVRLRSSPVRGRLTLVPVVNEPAFRRGQRTAEDGLDLARTCPGRRDGSVTEQVAWELSSLIRTADHYIDLHTGGTRLRILPLVGYMLHADRGVLDEQRRMARAFGLPIVWGTDPRLEGRSLSVARDHGIPAIYAEYQGGCDLDPAGVEAYVSGCLGVMRELGMIEARSPTLDTHPAPLVIEDDRLGSGHLQVDHPVPREGFFSPCVALGQLVDAGEPLGTLSDLLGRRVETVKAVRSGLVLMLHTCPRVEAGESIAAVLETDPAR